jgi:hypothetical protein
MGRVTREYSLVDSMSCVRALIMTLLIKNRYKNRGGKLCASKQAKWFALSMCYRSWMAP